jgi:hypothetical protein
MIETISEKQPTSKAFQITDMLLLQPRYLPSPLQYCPEPLPLLLPPGQIALQ